jgi:hypothetical protein
LVKKIDTVGTGGRLLSSSPDDKDGQAVGAVRLFALIGDFPTIAIGTPPLRPALACHIQAAASSSGTPGKKPLLPPQSSLRANAGILDVDASHRAPRLADKVQRFKRALMSGL